MPYIDIEAPAEPIWANLTRVSEIDQKDDTGWLTRSLGFPRPLRAELNYNGVGAYREAIFTNGLIFHETVLDEHVVVGGKFFDVLTGTYQLEKLNETTYRLHLYSFFKMNTTFNFYASWWAGQIMNDIQVNILKIIKQRAENTFFITDVFSLKRYTGNQLAVFTECDQLTTEEMQQIAREINFSETTFITSLKEDGAYRVRIFTPTSEVDFAGHPTLGTAYILRNYFELNATDNIVLNLNVGKIEVNYKQQVYWMTHRQPVFGSHCEHSEMADILNLSVSEINTNLPIQEVSTGLPFTIVPVNSLEALKKIKVEVDKLYKLSERGLTKGILAFCPDGYMENQDIASRVFVSHLGIPEDPATGSGTGCLAAYLLYHNFMSMPEIKITIGQGYEIGRPSELYIAAKADKNQYDIRIGGKVFEIAQGEWF